MSGIHICFSPKADRVITVADETYTRYCFGCRKHLIHQWRFEVYDEVTEENCWYDPLIDLRCEGCGMDRADFPGLYRDGPRPIPELVLDRFRLALGPTSAPNPKPDPTPTKREGA